MKRFVASLCVALFLLGAGRILSLRFGVKYAGNHVLAADKIEPAVPSGGSVKISEKLKRCVTVDFPRKVGSAIIYNISSVQPITETECTITVDTSVPVIIRLKSGIFPVVPTATYAVNFSDRPPLYLKADTSGVLSIPVMKEVNYCALTVSKVNAEDLLKTKRWKKITDMIAHPITGERVPCGSVTRDNMVKHGRGPSLKLAKKLYDGTLAWASEPVSVVSGKSYLLSGYYHITESSFGSKIRMLVTLKGAGKPAKILREHGLTYFVVPTFGQTWRYSQLRFTIPDGYKTATVILSLKGSRQTIWWDDLRLREAPRTTFLVNRPLKPEDTRPEYSLEEVRAIWKNKSSRAAAYVRQNNGATQLIYNDKPMSLLSYNHYLQKPQAVETGPMLKAGIRWHFAASATYPKRWWKGKDSYDFSDIQSNIEAILRFDPEALIMLRVNVFPRYREWGELYPDAVWRDHDGRKVAGYKTTIHKPKALPAKSKDFWYPSYSADEYRTSVCKALRALAQHIKSFDTGKSVAGIMLTGGNDAQWQRPLGHMYEGFDYSPGAQRDFHRYLRSLYQDDVERLRQAWDDPKVTFGTAVLPPFAARNPASWFLNPAIGKDQRVIDANAYGDEGVARSIKIMAQTLKDALGSGFFVCTYFHDMTEFGGRSSHELLFGSSAIDAVVHIPSYSTYRSAGSVGQVIGAFGSHTLHNKLFLAEFDFRTHVSFIAKDAFTGLVYSFGGAVNEREFAHLARRDAAATIARGAGAWYLVMPGHMFNTKGYRGYVAEIARAYSNAAASPQPNDNAQIALFIDQRIDLVTRYSYSRGLSSMTTAMPIRTAFNRSGVSYNIYFLSDLAHPNRPRYKAYFFLSAPTITAKQIAWVQKNLQKDGNILVFFNAVGISSSAGTFPENAYKLTGMNIRFDGSATGVYRTVPLPQSDPIAKKTAG